QRVDQLAHRVDRRAVATDLVASADPSTCGHGGGFGDPDQFQRQVAVQIFGTAGGGHPWPAPGLYVPGWEPKHQMFQNRTALAPVDGEVCDVRQDGRVTESPTETTPDSGPADVITNRPTRTSKDMVRSLVVLLIPVAIIVGFVWLRGGNDV